MISHGDTVKNETFGLTQDDLDKANNGYSTLGPAYFSARRMAEKLMQGTDPSPFHEVAAKAADEVKDKLYEYIENHLLSDVECNIQGHVYHMVDDTVQALLTGQEWAMKRYPYHSHGRGEEVRAAVAKHGGDELLMARITDLEKEIARLRESLSFRSGH